MFFPLIWETLIPSAHLMPSILSHFLYFVFTNIMPLNPVIRSHFVMCNFKAIRVMNTERIEKDNGKMDLALYMAEVIEELR